MSWSIPLSFSCRSRLVCVVKVKVAVKRFIYRKNKQTTKHYYFKSMFLSYPVSPLVCGAYTYTGKHCCRGVSGCQQQFRGHCPRRLWGSGEPLFQVCRWKTEDAHAEEGGTTPKSSQVSLPISSPHVWAELLILLCSNLHETVTPPFHFLWHSHSIIAFRPPSDYQIDHEAVVTFCEFSMIT